MATSGSTKVNVVSTGNIYLLFSWSAGTQNIASNYTPVSWSLKLVASGAGANIQSTAQKDCLIKVNGTTVFDGTVTIGLSADTTKTLKSGTINIYHNSDGTKSFNYSFSQEIAITFSGSWIGTKTGSGTGVLNTIPRASDIKTVTGDTIGSSIKVDIDRKVDTFTHKLYYTFGEKNNVLLKSDIATSHTFTPDISDCSYIPNAPSGSATLKLETYSGTTLIGSKTKSITLNVPDSVVPTISNVAIAEGNTTVVPTSWGVFVQSKSKLAITVSSSGAYGSKITNTKVVVDGSTYSGSPVTTNLINSTGQIDVVVTVTDSRGRPATTTKKVTILAYEKPHIEEFSVVRCDANGNANSGGSYAKATVIGGVSSLSGKNQPISYVIQYKKTTDEAYTNYTINNTSDSINTDVTLSGIAGASSYNFRLVISDYFNSIPQSAPTLLSVFRTMNFKAGGHGVAIGKMAEKEDVFEVALKTQLSGGLEPIFLEANIDLDEIKTPNFYTGENISTHNYVNCPLTSGTFYLEVVSCGDEGQIRQTITSCSKANPVTFIRYFYQDSWGDWEPSAPTIKNVDVTDTDLNNYTVSGQYYFGTDYTPINVPDGVINGILVVMALSSTRIKQLWYRFGTINSNDHETYVRTYMGDVWSDWEQIVTMNDVYPVGSVYITQTNTNPASKLGGNWELIDKDFTPVGGNATITLGKASSGTLAFYKSGKNIYCRLTFVNNATLNDTAATVATINLASIGVTDLTYSKYPIGQTDGGAALLMMGVNATTGVIAVNDVIDKGGSHVVSSGATCYVEWSNTIAIGNMMDSACNKFYWKRTA